jgi:hypothetical protein
VTVEVSPEVEARLINEARKRNISVEVLLERLVTEIATEAKPIPELPVWHLGEVGALRRVDIYDNVD